MENTRIVLIRIVNVAASIVGFFLTIRIILKLFGANAGAPIVAWIYSISDGFAYPFQGIFGDLRLPGGFLLEVAAIIALFAYVIAAYLIISLINSLIHPLPHEDLSVEHHHGLGLHH